MSDKPPNHRPLSQRERDIVARYSQHMTLPVALYAQYWSVLLERNVTTAEANEAIDRINAEARS